MTSPVLPTSPVRPRLPALPPGLSDGFLLTTANLLAAAGNYLFQALMRRHLPWNEFGYLNTTLSLIVLAGVPLTAASQTLTHHLAHIRARGDEERILLLQAASRKFLGHLTWMLFLAGLLLLYPLTDFLRFPRMSLAWLALLWIPINLWSTLGGAWCTGLGRFRLLSLLLILTAVVRLIAGTIAVQSYPWAEAGIFAGILSGGVMAGVVALGHAQGGQVRLRSWLTREFCLYGAAALAVSFGAFVFLQGDQVLAQRHFPGDDLGRYSGAGLLGRTVIWAGLPVLTVYFTRRSGHVHAAASSAPLLWIYLGLIMAAAGLVVWFRFPLLSLFLASHDPALAGMIARFAWTMLPLGLLQAMGCHFLAARRIPECLVFGLCGLGYFAALAEFGQTPDLMLNAMGWSGLISIGAVGALFLILYKNTGPSKS